MTNPDAPTEAPERPRGGRVRVTGVAGAVAALALGCSFRASRRRLPPRRDAIPIALARTRGFVGSFAQQVRVVGEAAKPQAILYRADLSLLDVMIEVGGLTEFADGNRATLIRAVDGVQNEYRVRLDDLLREGDISANVYLRPGDVLIVPESFF